MTIKNRTLILSLLMALAIGITGCSVGPEREMTGQPGGAVSAEAPSPAYGNPWHTDGRSDSWTNPWYSDGRSERWTNPWRTDLSRNPWESGHADAHPGQAGHS